MHGLHRSRAERAGRLLLCLWLSRVAPVRACNQSDDARGNVSAQAMADTICLIADQSRDFASTFFLGRTVGSGIASVSGALSHLGCMVARSNVIAARFSDSNDLARTSR